MTFLRRARPLFAASLGTLALLLVAARTTAETSQCDRTSSLGAAVDACPAHVNPCCLERVDAGTARYQIMKDSDPAKPASVLIVALRELDGRTSSDYTTPPVVTFWSEGWKAALRHLFAGAGPGPALALAMNAQPTRGEARIHLHISCVSPKLLAALRGHAFSSDAWTPIVLPGISALHVPDRTFRVRTTRALIDDPDPATPPRNPFSLAIADAPAPDLQEHALAVVGPAEGGGWYVLDRTLTPTDPKQSGYLEDMLEETCATNHESIPHMATWRALRAILIEGWLARAPHRLATAYLDRNR